MHYMNNVGVVSQPIPINSIETQKNVVDEGQISEQGLRPVSTNSISKSNFKEKIIEKIIYVPIKENANRNNEIVQNTSDNNFNINSMNNSSIQKNNVNLREMKNTIGELKSPIILPDIPSYEVQEQTQEISDWSAEFRNNIDFHIPGATIEPAKHLKYNNMNFAVKYALAKNLEIGIDVRQENFYMEYYGYGIEGLKSTFQQQPNFTSGDVFARWMPIDYDWFKAGSQISLGGNNVGYLGRCGLNLVFSPSEHLNMIVGFENSWLFYNFQNNWFNSKKLGVNYGILYNF
jgi:hypothetical protein